MRNINNFPFIPLWKIYIIPITILAFLNYMLYYAFYLDEHLDNILKFYIVYALITLVISVLFYKSLQRSIKSFVSNFIGCKILKFLLTIFMLIFFLNDIMIDYEYGLITIGLFFLISQLCDNYIFLCFSDSYINAYYFSTFR